MTKLEKFNDLLFIFSSLFIYHLCQLNHHCRTYDKNLYRQIRIAFNPS